MQKLLHVVGARPNFMKIAPVMKAFDRTGEVRQTLVHTGQHYDDELSKYFFEDLGLGIEAEAGEIWTNLADHARIKKLGVRTAFDSKNRYQIGFRVRSRESGQKKGPQDVFPPSAHGPRSEGERYPFIGFKIKF